MYESFFNFTRRPFSAAPSADQYFGSAAMEHARQTISRCVELTQGPALLLGPAGTGKSLLCHVIAEHFRARLRVALLANARLTSRRELLQTMLFELDLPYRDMEEGELRLSLVDFLEATPSALLLIVDEAHTLSLRLLEEIRMITNVTRHGQPKVRLILAGGMSLEEKFTSPKLESFNQRIAARCYLQPLLRDETYEYVRHHLRIVGGDPANIFDESALRAIHQATDGIPRLVNQVCDYALLLASIAGHEQINAAIIEEAWLDLQQLPAPLPSATPIDAASGGIIEFGQLDDATITQQNPISIDVTTGDSDDQLDRIERGMATVIAIEHYEHDLDDFGYAKSPAAERAPTPKKHNPFGDDFQEEELVIDHYASLEATHMRRRPHVSCAEGRELAAALREDEVAVESNSVITLSDNDTEEFPRDAEELEEQSESQDSVFSFAESSTVDPASDPVLPDPVLPEPVRETNLSVEPSIVVSEFSDSCVSVVAIADDIDLEQLQSQLSERSPEIALPNDDRDLLVVDEEPQTDFPLTSGARARRQDYRQLFARLRKS